MLASTATVPAGPGWAYEFKWDGVRALAAVRAGQLHFYARTGAEITLAYPELAGLLAGLPDDTVLDGEVVAMDAAGRPSFAVLAERMHVRDPARAAGLAATHPVTYMIFDLLRVGGVDLCDQPWTQRRDALDALHLGGTNWVVPPWFTDRDATVAAAQEHELEGVMAKRLTGRYRPGQRSPDWIKGKFELTDDFLIGGWRPGARAIGGLLVGLPADGGLSYHGRVGGGIGATAERQLLAVLQPLRTDACPFRDVPRADAAGATWVRPEIVVEVRYGQRTPDDRLRFPRFVRLRPDRTAASLELA